MSNIIPIVFSANEAYARFIPTVLLSVKENSDPSYFYQIYIFYSELSSQMKKMIRKSESEFMKIEFINVAEYVKNTELYTLAHFSKEMYYRLLIPEILKQYDKVVYLDCDVIVRNDISELYAENIDEYALAGVVNFCEKMTQNYILSIGLKPEQYINSGVLVFNNKRWHKDGLVSKSFQLIEERKDFTLPDQDVINCVCRGMIKYINHKWNYMWRPSGPLDDLKVQRIVDEQAKGFYIIHYISGIKPWKNKFISEADIWWSYAKRVPCSKKLYKEYINQTINSFTQKEILKEFDTTRIDIRNLGKSDNGVIVKGRNIIASKPFWIKSDYGQGCVLQTKEFRCHFTIQAVNDGKLTLTFLGRDYRIKNERLPLWIRFVSIRVDDREILTEPLSVWHNKYKQFSFDVKDGQIVHVCFVREYYQYSKDELRSIILKIKHQSKYVQDNIRKITKTALRMMKKPSYPSLYSVSYKKDKKIVRICGVKFTFKQKNTAA